MNDIVLNQDHEPTDLTVPEDFGNGLSFIPSADMPEIEGAELGFNIQPESLEFKNPGESVRAVFNGFTTFKVKDQAHPGEYRQQDTAVLQTKNGIKINMGANLLKQLRLLPVGTAIQITYTGEEKTASGNKVKVYRVETLNVGRVPVLQTHAPKRENPAEVEPELSPKPKFKNSFLATEYWLKAKELRFTHQEGMDHLAEYGNDFEEALAMLIGL